MSTALGQEFGLRKEQCYNHSVEGRRVPLVAYTYTHGDLMFNSEVKSPGYMSY